MEHTTHDEDTTPDRVEVLRREVGSEPEDGALLVEVVDGLSVRVPPAGQWRQSAVDAIHAGRFNAWAESVLSEDDAQAWIEADLTIDEVNAFYRKFGELTGIRLGGSRASRRSSRSTARR